MTAEGFTEHAEKESECPSRFFFLCVYLFFNAEVAEGFAEYLGKN
jgi:hypothetical protein